MNNAHSFRRDHLELNEKKAKKMAGETFCSNCGSQIDPGARFCASCGSPVLSKPPYVAKAQPSPTQRPAATPPPQLSVTTLPRAERLALMESKKKSPGTAIVLSVLIMGLGQIYVGKIARAVGFWVVALILIFTFVGILVLPILWIFNLYDAHQLANRHNEELMRLA